MGGIFSGQRPPARRSESPCDRSTSSSDSESPCDWGASYSGFPTDESASSSESISHGGSTLPPKPDSVCAACWSGPLGAGLFNTRIKQHGDVCRLPHLQYRYHTGGRSYSITRSRLERRASLGCGWCKFLSDLLADEAKSGWSVEGELQITVGTFAPGEVITVSPANAQVLAVIINGSVLFTGIVHTSKDDPSAPYIVARDPVLDVLSLSTMSLAKTLIDECVEGHEHCNQISPPSDVDLPTRLIDCSFNSPRLVDKKGQRGRYLALSYVWGPNGQPHRTTTSNISVYLTGIPIVDIPETIYHAICVTEVLKFQYLWVDSLCIIQDSDEDKAIELGRMHLIYRNAHLTIVAADAEHAEHGFLDRPRQPRPGVNRQVALPFILPPKHGASTADGPQVGQVRATSVELNITRSPDVPVAWSHTFEEPIDRRGWCLQEFYLSPRLLLFTWETVRFRCQTATKSVGNSFYSEVELRIPKALFHKSSAESQGPVKRCPRPPQRVSPSKESSLEWGQIRDSWTALVCAYTRRAISDPSDKLVAFGAIVEAFHPVMGSEYLAGLWGNVDEDDTTFLQDLLWITRKHVLVCPTYRAPSWSWAAVDGEVLIQGWPCGIPSSVVAVAQVVHCHVELAHPAAPYGQVKDADLVLRAALIRPEGRLRFDRPMGGTRYCPFGGRGTSATGDTSILEDRTLRGWCDMDSVADRETQGESEVWFLPLLLDKVQHDVFGLLVRFARFAELPSGTRSGKEGYRRIGYFLADGCDWHKLYSWPVDDDLVTVAMV